MVVLILKKCVMPGPLPTQMQRHHSSARLNARPRRLLGVQRFLMKELIHGAYAAYPRCPRIKISLKYYLAQCSEGQNKCYGSSAYVARRNVRWDTEVLRPKYMIVDYSS